MIQTQSFPRQKKEVKSYVDHFRSVFLTFSKKWHTGVTKKGRNMLVHTSEQRERIREETDWGKKKNRIEEHSLQSLPTQNELTLT